jgi:hypothetical protein
VSAFGRELLLYPNCKSLHSSDRHWRRREHDETCFHFSAAISIRSRRARETRPSTIVASTWVTVLDAAWEWPCSETLHPGYRRCGARPHQQPRHANQARLQFLEERRCIAALELAANAHLSLRRRCHAPEKQISRNIETNCRNPWHSRSGARNVNHGRS